MARIAIAGFQHETNTFAPTPARLEDFVKADGWPALTRGGAVPDAVQGINLGIAGFIDAALASSHSHDLVPILWCSASPSAPVTRDAFETIANEIVEGVATKIRELDALYLDLHGAMVAEHFPDGEGELLRRLRRIAGPDFPIVVSLDLHANITPAMVALSDLLLPCLTYPHVDLADTGRRALVALEDILANGKPRAKAHRALPFLIPLVWQCTMIDPMRGLYDHLASQRSAAIRYVVFAPGFPMADIADAGPALVVYGDDQEEVEEKADKLASDIESLESKFAGMIWQTSDAIQAGLSTAERVGRPVILADTEDNPGAGANSDMTGLLRGMLQARVSSAVIANICDPEVASAAHQAGLGATINIPLGEKTGFTVDGPLHAPYTVMNLGNGQFDATGPFYKGARMDLGPMARLRVQNVDIVVTSKKQQAADQAMLRHVDIDPHGQKLLGLKSSVHFRADFQSLAADILIVAAGGPNPVDHRRFQYKNLRAGVRLMPR